MSRISLMFDTERCIGCKSCEAACKQEHGLGAGEFRNRLIWNAHQSRPEIDFLFVSCQHCTRPACLRACPLVPKAIEKDPDTGVVRLDEDRCTGCGECSLACPYGAIGYDPVHHHATKCDLCHDRRSHGLEPACVSVCPGRALSFGERDAMVSRSQESGRAIRDHDHFLLGPATVYLDPISDAPATPGPHVSADAFEARRQPAILDDPRRYDALHRHGGTAIHGGPKADRAQEDHRASGCNICFNCCTTEFHFQDGRLVRVTGNAADPVLEGRICPKSQLSVQLHNSDRRLTRPLKRVGARGEGRFEPVGWDQVLDEIGQRLRDVRDAYGPEALGIFAGTRTGILATQGYIRLFSQLWGTPNIEETDPYCSASKNIAYRLVQGRAGGGNSFTESDIGRAQLYLYFGDNQAETRPVNFGMVNDWRIRHGTRLVVVDPRLTITASKADRWHAIRPGTDMALALALIHHIFRAGLHDRRFCRTWVLGWEAWQDFVFDKGYTPEWAEGITDIPAAEIERLAEEIATADGCMIFASRGVNQHTNAVQTNRTLMFLAAITGNWGRPGGGFFNTTAGVPVAPNVPHNRRTWPAKPAIRRSPGAWLEAMTDGNPYPVKALIACNNPLSHWPDQNRTREAFRDLDLMVHIELFENETSAFADYVLPAATGIEEGEIGRASDDRRIVWIDKMIDPPGDARTDGWIWVELGKRLGFDDVLKDDYKDSAVFWDEVCIDNDFLRGCTQRRLHSVPWRWVRFPVADETAQEEETLYLEGTTALDAPPGHRFPTASGRLEFWSEAHEAMFATVGLSALPEFYSEREQLVDLPYIEQVLDNGADGALSPFSEEPATAASSRIVAPSPKHPASLLREQGFDTELITGRPPAPQFHSWTHFAWQAQEMWPDLYLQIHPKKASERGIRDGALVRVETAHGAITARAWVYAGIRPSAVFMPIGWGERQPFHPWQSVNFLTDHQQRDPVSEQTNLKTLLCRVSPLAQ